jgi:hypothetical protein
VNWTVANISRFCVTPNLSPTPYYCGHCFSNSNRWDYKVTKGRFTHAMPFTCHYPATTLPLPCYDPATTLLRPCHYPATTLPLPCYDPATTLLRPCHYPATTLPLPCHSPTVPNAGRSPTCRLWTAEANLHIRTMLWTCRSLERSLSKRHIRGMAFLNETRPHRVNQMGKTQYKHLAERHGWGTAWCVWIHLNCQFPYFRGLTPHANIRIVGLMTAPLNANTNNPQ